MGSLQAGKERIKPFDSVREKKAQQGLWNKGDLCVS